MPVTNRCLALLLATCPLTFVRAEQLIPVTVGTSWQYKMTEEVGKGIGFADLKPDADGKVRANVMYRIDGMQNVDGNDLLKFEMHRAGLVTNTDLMTVDERGMVCSARINLDGELIKLDPPQTIIATPLRRGASWDFDGQAADTRMHQHYEVKGEEDIKIPAGKFHAFHIHGEQTSPSPMTIDRWFVVGTGIVRDVTTTMRPKSRELLRRIILELKEPPKVADRPEVKPREPPKKLSAQLASEPLGNATTSFSGARTPKIYARWQGHGLREHAKVRVAWVVEDLGDIAPPGYKIDEASTIAEGPNSFGTFTFSRPDDGWVAGDYRVEFYVDDALAQTVALKIGK
jgi:hypothetical protein